MLLPKRVALVAGYEKYQNDTICSLVSQLFAAVQRYYAHTPSNMAPLAQEWQYILLGNPISNGVSK
jgi:hypothetical protein